MPERALKLVLTCEHASARVPARYRAVAERAGPVLRTHRGYDPGALDLARHLARHLEAPLFVGTASRLLVELNRSLHHPQLWSEFSAPLTPAQKQAVLRDYYYPYRKSVETCIRREIQRGRRVLHLSIHSFAPIWQGRKRPADIGLLYDPRRPLEAAACAAWKRVLGRQAPDLRVRRNYPYLGRVDGLVTFLRQRFRFQDYVGIELEVNQSFPLEKPRAWEELQELLSQTTVGIAGTVARGIVPRSGRPR